MKQTAVEWLIDALNKEMGLISFVPNADEEYKKGLFNIIQQAKEMEKQQIIDAFGVGCQVESTRLIGYHEMSEQYYNETYGGNK